MKINEGTTEKNRRNRQWLLAIGVAAFLWLAAFAVLYLDYAYSLPLLGLIVVVLLSLEKKGFLDRFFVLVTKERKIFLSAVVFGAVLLPLALSGKPYSLHIAVLMCVYAILALGLNFPLGLIRLGWLL